MRHESWSGTRLGFQIGISPVLNGFAQGETFNSINAALVASTKSDGDRSDASGAREIGFLIGEETLDLRSQTIE